MASKSASGDKSLPQKLTTAPSLPARMSDIIDPSLIPKRIKKPLSRRVPDKLKTQYPKIDFSVGHFNVCRIIDGQKWVRILSRNEGIDYLKSAIEDNLDYTVSVNSNNYITIEEKDVALRSKNTNRKGEFSLSAEMKKAVKKTGLPENEWLDAVLAKAASLQSEKPNGSVRINLASPTFDIILKHTGSKAAAHEWISIILTHSVRQGLAQKVDRKYRQDTQDGIERLGVSVPYDINETFKKLLKDKNAISGNALSVTLIHHALKNAVSKSDLIYPPEL